MGKVVIFILCVVLCLFYWAGKRDVPDGAACRACLRGELSGMVCTVCTVLYCTVLYCRELRDLCVLSGGFIGFY